MLSYPVTDTFGTIRGGDSGLIESRVQGLRNCEAQVVDRRLGIGDIEKEVFIVRGRVQSGVSAIEDFHSGSGRFVWESCDSTEADRQKRQ